MAHKPKKIKLRRFLFWVLATVITLFTIVYQRKTGPTNPYRGTYTIENITTSYKLKRSPESGTPLIVLLPGNEANQALLFWREYPTDRPWKLIPMENSNSFFEASIPSQPPAGKVEYTIQLKSEQGEIVQIPHESDRIIARFKNPVPFWALAPHIILMFVGMLLSNRVGIGAFWHESVKKNLIWITFICLLCGIGIFGPVVQKFAFGQYWTGWPIGTDLTDNKSLIILLIWLFPVWRILRNKDPRISLISASIATLVIFMIPHSLLGSEYDYSGTDTVIESVVEQNN